MINRVRRNDFDALSLIEGVILAPNKLTIRLEPARLANIFEVSRNAIDADAMAFETAFSLRRRGIETKLMIEGEVAPRDKTLLRNIALGHRFLAAIKAGQNTQEIAEDQV